MKEWSRLKKAVVIVVVGFFGLAGIGSITDSQQNIVNPPPTPTPTPVQGIEIETESQAEPTLEPPPPPPQVVTPPPTPEPSPQPSSNCDPNYSGCVPIASDVDCAGGSGNGPAYVTGPVSVIGSDIYGLDRDGDGIGCE